MIEKSNNRHKHKTKHYVLLSLLPLFIFCFLFFTSFSSDAAPTHLDKSKPNTGCSNCHKGHGKRGTALLQKEKENLCFECHGPSGRGRAKDIYNVIMKPSSHPVLQTAMYHKAGEELPEKVRSTPRHVSCFDCHNVHHSEKGDAIKGIQGYSGKGVKVRRVSKEYELCYNCHSDSANLRSEESNISLKFDVTNPSFHPVEAFGKNTFVPSLTRGFSRSSAIRCSDCHGNDNPSGPQGPHGSIYEPILKYQYTRTTGSESPNAYKLCYECHNRTSILSDESFKSHKKHIVYNQISCAQCHDAHGSRIYGSLINFDVKTAYPNSQGEFTFMPGLRGRPRCFLSCHVSGRVYEHKIDMKSLKYCVNDNCLPNW